MVFPVVMYGCESWTIKKAECQRIDAFELWYWRILLRVPWTARRSILKEITSEQSLEDWCWSWNSNTLATWCEEQTRLKIPWCWEGLRVGGKGENRGWDGWMASPTQWTWIWINSWSWWWTGKPGMLQSMGFQRLDTTEQLNWTGQQITEIELPLMKDENLSSRDQWHLKLQWSMISLISLNSWMFVLWEETLDLKETIPLVLGSIQPLEKDSLV